MAYNKLLIADEPISNCDTGEDIIGYEFKLQYPSYRGTFLSCIEDLSIWVDRELIDRDKIYFHLNEKWFLMDELPECFKEYWFALDYATIRVMKPGGLPPGEHEVRVYIKHRIPYTGYFGDYMVMEADESKMLAVQ